MLALALLLSLAATSADVDRAVQRYERAELQQARDQLRGLAQDSTLPASERARVRAYLAACLSALGDEGGAREQLLQLAIESPEYRLDPGAFLPEVILLAEEARKQAEAKRARVPPPKDEPRPPPVADAPPKVDPRPSPPLALAFVPFGVGQFANGDAGKGRFFLVSEVLAFGAAGVSYGVYVAHRRGYNAQGEALFDNPRWAGTLQVIAVSSLVVGTGLLAGGIFEALVSRPRAEKAAWIAPTPNGLLVRF